MATTLDYTLRIEREALLQLAYSLDVASYGYLSFRSMHLALAGVRFRNAEEVRKWSDNWITTKTSLLILETVEWQSKPFIEKVGEIN